MSGDSVLAGVQYALGTNEVNAAMGLVCATPTAGASGTLPGVVFSIADTMNLNHEQQVRFLFTSAAFGMVVANNAMIAGATGGCQAEVGSASARPQPQPLKQQVEHRKRVPKPLRQRSGTY